MNGRIFRNPRCSMGRHATGGAVRMVNSRVMKICALVVCTLMTGMLMNGTATCAEKSLDGDSDANVKKYRELYVPSSELETLLEAAPQRAMVTRGEFDELLRAVAKLDSVEMMKSKRLVAPIQSVLTRSEYDVRIADGRAAIFGTLRLEILGEHAVAVPLEWRGASLMEATLDGEPAAMATLDDGRRLLLIPGTAPDSGENTTSDENKTAARTFELSLKFMAPLETMTVLQTLRCTLPEAAARRVTLSAPGDVEVRRGAAVVMRAVVADATMPLGKVTQFELTPARDAWDMTLTLNSHARRGGMRITARSVQVAEVTCGYQRMYATFSMQVLRQAQQQFRFVLPEGFDAESVELLESIAPADDETATATMSQWRMIDANGDAADKTSARVLEVLLREPAIGTLVFGMTALYNGSATTDSLLRTDVDIAEGRIPLPWNFSAIRPMATESHGAVFGLILEDRIEPYHMETDGLVPLSTTLLEKAIPAAALVVEPGLPVVRSVAAYYAPLAGSVDETTPVVTADSVTADSVTPGDAATKTNDPEPTKPAWTLSTGFRLPAERIIAVTRNFVEYGTSGATLHCDLSLVSERDKQFEARVDLPGGWNVTRVTDVTDPGRPPIPLTFERLSATVDATEAKTNEATETEGTGTEGTATDSVVVSNGVLPSTRLRIVPPVDVGGRPSAIAEGLVWKIAIDADADPGIFVSETPDGSAGNGNSEKSAVGGGMSEDGDGARRVTFLCPAPTVVGAMRESGATAIGCRDDYAVRTEGDVSEALVPLLESEISGGGFRTGGVNPQLAWSQRAQCAMPWLVFEKISSRSTARAYSFFRVEQERIAAHLELIWKIDQAKATRLRFALPNGSPEVSVSSPDGRVSIRQTTSRTVDERRVWEVETVSPLDGVVRLVVNFTAPQPELRVDAMQEVALPLPTFPDAVHMSGLFAVEGNAELETNVRTDARRIDIGELAAAESYTPGQRLIGAWSFVAAPPPVRLDLRRYPAFDLTPAIAERLRLDVQMTNQADGIVHTVAEFTLRCAPQTLLLDLPTGAELSAIHLDSVAKRPIAAAGASTSTFLVDVPAVSGGGGGDVAAMELRVLRVVYGTPRTTSGADSGSNEVLVGGLVAASGRMAIVVPRMRLADGRVMPVLSARCRVLPPEGTRILSDVATGTADGSGVSSVGFVNTSQWLVRDVGKMLFGDGRKSENRATFGCSAAKESARKTANMAATQGDGIRLAAPEGSISFESPFMDEFWEESEIDYSSGEESDSASASAKKTSKSRVAGGRLSSSAPPPPMSEAGAMPGMSMAPPIPAEEILAEKRDMGAPAAVPVANAPISTDRAAMPARRTAGIRSLPIELAMNDDGERLTEILLPTMSGTVVDGMDDASGDAGLARTEVHYMRDADVRLGAIEWVVGLGTLLGGLAVWRRGYIARILYVVIAWFVAVMLPFVVQMCGMFGGGNGATGGILRAPYSGNVGLIRGAATAMAAATILLVVLWLLWMACCAARVMLTAIVARGLRKNRDDGGGGNGAEGGAAMGSDGTCAVAAGRGYSWKRAVVIGIVAVLMALVILFMMLYAVPMVGAAMIPSPQDGMAGETLPPVVIPGDAIVVPYHPTELDPGVPECRNDQTVFVPYADYEAMRRRIRERDRISVDGTAAVAAGTTVWTLPDGAVREAVAATRDTEYRLRTESTDSISVNGSFEVEIFHENGDIVLPLPVAGAMIEAVSVDGEAASLVTLSTTTAVPEIFVQQMASQAALNMAMPAPTPTATIGVRMAGRGVHRVELRLRFAVSRLGGVRTISGVVPIGAAARLTIEVPEAGTTLSIGDESTGNILRESHETKSDHERVTTSLDTASGGATVAGSPPMQCGRLRVQWRPRVITDGAIDAGLTVDSLSVVDLTEDGTRLAWRATPSFRSGEYQQFRVEIPMGDLPAGQQWRIERVTGTNVRVWDQRDDAQRMIVDIELLGTAKDSETFTVHLFQPPMATRTVPVPLLSGTLRHTGCMIVRRSGTVSAQCVKSTGTEQIDVPSVPDGMIETGETPLWIMPILAYQFRSHPVPFVFSVETEQPDGYFEADTELRVTPTEAIVDARIRANPRQLYHEMTIALPPGLRVDAVTASGDPAWTLEPAPGATGEHTAETIRQIMSKNISAEERYEMVKTFFENGDRITFRFTEVRSDVTTVHLRGTFVRPVSGDGDGNDAENESVTWMLPWFRLIGGNQSVRNTVVIQADPSFETTWESEELFAQWRPADDEVGQSARQRLVGDRLTMARDVLFGWYQNDGDQVKVPFGTVKLTRRTPLVDAVLVSNLRFTARDVEETMLVDLTIQRAGIREIVFDLPARMSDARFRVPGLRRTVIESIAAPTDGDGTEDKNASNDVAAMVRVRLELQDEVMGRVRVLVENDLPLVGEEREVAFPQLRMPVQTLRRFATIENSGRDEMIVAERTGMTLIDRRQEAWTLLAGLLGSEPVGAEAFEAATDARLRVGTHRREQAEWVDARIGLSETSLIVDSFGEYRARQIWSIDNATRPLLEVELPDDATLWGVTVAGQPVRPIAVEAEEPIARDNDRKNTAPVGSRVKIPLVKAAPGDPDYEVVVIYAGKLSPVRASLPVVQLGPKTEFPLIRVHGIEVRRSNVRLFLPKGVKWFDFDGTLGQVDSEQELVAQRIEYDTDQLARLVQKRRESGDRMTQIRAEENLRILAPRSDYGGYDVRSAGGSSSSISEYAEKLFSRGELSVGKAVESNRKIVSLVQEELGTVRDDAVTDSDSVVVDNRSKLNDAFVNQSAQRARNVVQGLVTEMPSMSGASSTSRGPSKETEEWFQRNSLEAASEAKPGATGRSGIERSGPGTVQDEEVESLLRGNDSSSIELDVEDQGGIAMGGGNERSYRRGVLAPELEEPLSMESQPSPVQRQSRLAPAQQPISAIQQPGVDKAKDALQPVSQSSTFAITESDSSPEDRMKIDSSEDGKKSGDMQQRQEDMSRYRSQVQQQALSNRINAVGNRNSSAGSGFASNADLDDLNRIAEDAALADLRNSGMLKNVPSGQGMLGRTGGMGGGMNGMGISGGMGMGGMGGSSSANRSPLGSAEMVDEDISFSNNRSGKDGQTADRKEMAEGLLPAGVSASRGLMSLMIGWDESELAADAELICFTTPGGDLTLTAHARPEVVSGGVMTTLRRGPLGSLFHTFWILLAIGAFYTWQQRRRHRIDG